MSPYIIKKSSKETCFITWPSSYARTHARIHTHIHTHAHILVVLNILYVQIAKQHCESSDCIPSNQEGKWSELEIQLFKMLLLCSVYLCCVSS